MRRLRKIHRGIEREIIHFLVAAPSGDCLVSLVVHMIVCSIVMQIEVTPAGSC